MEGLRSEFSIAACVAVVLVVASVSTVGLARATPSGGLVSPSLSASLANITLTRQGLMIPNGTAGSFDSLQAGYASVLYDNGLYRMWYFGCPPSYACEIGYASSNDGWHWQKHGPVLAPSGGQESLVVYPDVIKVASTYRMWYTGTGGGTNRIFSATSPDGVNWTRDGLAIDVGTSGSPDAFGAAWPRVLYTGGQYTMWYTGTYSPSPPWYSILMATSPDGLTWTKHGVVMQAGPAGSGDAYQVGTGGVARWGGAYQMLYIGYPDLSHWQTMYADSTDGSNWTRHGVVLPPLTAFCSLMIAANGTWLAYYTMRSGTTDNQIYLATFTPPSTGGGAAALDLTLLFVVLLILVPVAVVAVLVLWSRRRPAGPPPPS